MIKVVDIFAGPGGLSEGFASVVDEKGAPAFDVRLSIEKDLIAFQTLQLRSFYHQFESAVPDDYYKCLQGKIKLDALYAANPKEATAASKQCWNATLGPGGQPAAIVREKISAAIGDASDWVLIGGPPCQAYSIAGRSRNHGRKDYDPATDVRQRLYVEYLQILAEHRPAVFVMENVKGLLSATLGKERMFHRILEDLRNPAAAIEREGRGGEHVRSGGYRIHSLCSPKTFDNGSIEGAVIRSELYGIPQARHRIILLGIREDLTSVSPGILATQELVPASQVLDDLPKLRSGLSPGSEDSDDAWRICLHNAVSSRWANAGTAKAANEELVKVVRRNLGNVVVPRAGRGGEFVEDTKGEITSAYRSDWYDDSSLGGVCNHSSRGHMKKDLFRYMYAASYAQHFKLSPSLQHFPTELLPDHASADDGVAEGHFGDRFRVQVKSRPSTTIVSHISKDGHYYIHPDALQCRSLTVREAARLQTFPDNYFFCGPRTAQYIQVGNAVPPLLAGQIGKIVLDVLKQAGSNG